MKDQGILRQRHEEREPNKRARYEKYRPHPQTLAEKIAWGIRVSKLLEEDRIMKNGLTEIKSCTDGNIKIVHGKTGDGIHMVWTERDGHAGQFDKFGDEREAVTEYINRRILANL